MSNCEVVTFPLVSWVIVSFHVFCPFSYFDHHRHYTHHYTNLGGERINSCTVGPLIGVNAYIDLLGLACARLNQNCNMV